MSRIKTNLIAVAAIAILTAPCISTANESALYPPSGGVIRLHNDSGGLITAYRDRFRQARDNGERVIIDGICLSACTLAVGILPHGRVCVTPKAVLGFQAAWKPPPGPMDSRLFRILFGSPPRPLRLEVSKEDRIPSAAATQFMMNTYPPVLQQWINQHGGLTPTMIYLRGKELAAIVPKCLGSA
jgi:hypothetical protein